MDKNKAYHRGFGETCVDIKRGVITWGGVSLGMRSSGNRLFLIAMTNFV
jgi:hypothetical protein